MKRLQLEVGQSDEGERLDRFLARAGGISRGEARRTLDRGGVWVDGRRVKAASRALRPGQRIMLVLEEAGARRPSAPARALERARILFEDAHLVAVDKPPFVAAQPTLGSDTGDLIALASALVGQPLGLVHRLDIETSGVTLLAKDKATTRALAQAFRERRVAKRYLALVRSAPGLRAEGDVDLAIAPDPSRPGRRRTSRQGGAAALTHYRLRGRGQAETALVEVLPQSGRTHQIRVHLQAVGAPLLGDRLYGGPTSVALDSGASLPIPRVMLHAAALELLHPTKRRPLCIEAPLPGDFADLAGQLQLLIGAVSR